MSSLIELRDDIVDIIAIDDGMTASPYLPAVVKPPHAQITAGSPYLEPGDAYTFKIVRHNVFVIGTSGVDPGTSAKKLDELLNETILNLASAGYTIEAVSQPELIDLNGTMYPAASITTTVQIQLTETQESEI